MLQYHPIGVFDSGYGGLTVLKEIVQKLPQYDYMYLGDNARTPYGNRSFETVYHYTLQCVKYLFSSGCKLVIVACNTASAKALRTIQQNDLPAMKPGLRVLGVIRPTTEVIGNYSKTAAVGILATNGTVNSGSYLLETEKFFPQLKVYQQACPMWVPLIENNEHNGAGADYFVHKYLDALLHQSSQIDTLLLACTHYPLLINKIKNAIPASMQILSQGKIVANSLANYLQRHTAIEATCSKGGQIQFCTTDSVEDFNKQAAIFYGKPVNSKHIFL
jgi:glutamate racemase